MLPHSCCHGREHYYRAPYSGLRYLNTTCFSFPSCCISCSGMNIANCCAAIAILYTGRFTVASGYACARLWPKGASAWIVLELLRLAWDCLARAKNHTTRVTVVCTSLDGANTATCIISRRYSTRGDVIDQGRL